MDYNEHSFDNIEGILLYKNLTIVEAAIEWYKILGQVNSKGNGLELLEKLENENEKLKYEIGFKYINRDIKKKQFEVIGLLTKITSVDWSEKSYKNALIEKYVINEIGAQDLGFKSLPQPIVPEYENINNEHIEKMLEIIGIERQGNIAN